MSVWRGPRGTGRFPVQDWPMKEGGPRGKHGFTHGSEPEASDAHAATSISVVSGWDSAVSAIAIRMFPNRSTWAASPGGITVVESYWVTIAGPTRRFSALSAARS